MNGSEVIIESSTFAFPPILEVDHASSFFTLDNTNALDGADHVLMAVIAIKNGPRSGAAKNPKIRMVLEKIGSTVLRSIADISSGESILLGFGIKINSSSHVVATDGTLDPSVLDAAGLLKGCVRIGHETGNPILPLKFATNHPAQDVIKIPFLTVCIKDSSNPSNAPEKKLERNLTIELTDGTGQTVTKQIDGNLFAKFDDPQIDQITFRVAAMGTQPPSAQQTQVFTIQRANRQKHFCALAGPGTGSIEMLNMSNAGNVGCI